MHFQQDDVQTIIHHQLLSQQQAEKTQKKSRGFGVLRRYRQPSPLQSPVQSQASSPASSPNTPVAQHWKDRLRQARSSQPASAVYNQSDSPTPPDSSVSSKEDSFQTVSLDWAFYLYYRLHGYQKKKLKGSTDTEVRFIYRLVCFTFPAAIPKYATELFCCKLCILF